MTQSLGGFSYVNGHQSLAASATEKALISKKLVPIDPALIE
jgi:hypothetical protein